MSLRLEAKKPKFYLLSTKFITRQKKSSQASTNLYAGVRFDDPAKVLLQHRLVEGVQVLRDDLVLLQLFRVLLKSLKDKQRLRPRTHGFDSFLSHLGYGIAGIQQSRN